MKLLQIVPRDGTHRYGAMNRKQAEIRRRGRGTFSRARVRNAQRREQHLSVAMKLNWKSVKAAHVTRACEAVLNSAGAEPKPGGLIVIYKDKRLPAKMEARIAELEAEVGIYQDKADRVEQWLHRVYTEIEDRFLSLVDGGRGAPQRARGAAS